MAIESASEVTPDDIRERLKEIGERDSATRTEQPSPEVNGAAAAVSPAAPAAPATPEAPAAATTVDDEWWNGADVNHTMLRTASSKDVERMFQNAQRKIREQGEVINRQRTITPATAATPEPPAKPPAPEADPRLAEYELVQYTDAKRAREIMREWATEDAQRVLAEQREQETGRQRVAATVTAAKDGTAKIVADYGIDDATATFRVRAAVLPQLTAFAEQVYVEYMESGDPVKVAQADEARRLALQDPDNYRLAYEHIFGPPTQAPKPTITVPTVPKPADPPHSTAAAPSSAPRKVVATKKLPDDMDRSLSKLGGLSEEGLQRFKERVAANT